MPKRHRFLYRVATGEKGITGLETAIILIAFVVVAAVFAYTALSSGLFATQKSKQAINSGLEEAQSSMEVKGDVVAKAVAELQDGDVWINSDTASFLATQETGAGNLASGGTASLKIATQADKTAATYQVAYRLMSDTVDLTSAAATAGEMWIKSSANLAATLTNIKVMLSTDTTPFTSPDETLTFAAADWTTGAFVTSSDNFTGTAGIKSIGIQLIVAGGQTLASGTNIYLDQVRPAANTPVIDTFDTVWAAGASIRVDGDASTKMEGTASAKFTATGDIAAAQDLATLTIPSRNLSNNTTIDFWIRSSAAITGDATEYLTLTTVDATGNNSTDTSTLGAISANTWTKVSWDISGITSNERDAVTQLKLGLAGTGPTISTSDVIYLDAIETQPVPSTSAPMRTYANQVIVTLASVSGGEPIDFTTTSDADEDGIISDESTKNHRVNISYSDEYQVIDDLAWTVTKLGSADSDSLLENNEKFAITIDLTYVSNNAGMDSKKAGADRTFTLEIKPIKGAVMVIERTMPAKIDAVTNLH